ncbi:hypothetical protein QA596_00750 [Balneolales bacterium ANBcel1]|nr:hypothetical protein [Balneolales bacterium ANBcel1]
MEKEPKSGYQADLEHSLGDGVSPDNINLRTVSFWIILGIVIVVITLFGVYNMFSYNQFLSSQQAAIDADYHELNERRAADHRMLNSFEVVDEEARRYRIPIDSAMTLMVAGRDNAP